MNDDEDQLLYLCLGPLGAMGLAVALVPLRELTVASNFTFAFLALTIVVGDFGGRLPALATALVSALSLDFFLTRPYMHLAIADKNDLVAFFGLAACGLVAAVLGTPRRERDSARQRLDVVDRALRQVEAGGTCASRLQALADSAAAALPVAALVVRDDHGRRVAAAGLEGDRADEPGTVLAATEVALVGHGDWRVRRPPLPRDGVRVALVAGARPVGALDVWGDGRPAGRDVRRALAAVARVAAALLDAARQPAEAPPAEALWTVGGRR